MIRKLTVTDPDNLPVEWWPKVEGLKDLRELEFTDGVNVLWGPNGCGKSSILKLIARYMHCEQGGYSVVTGNSFRKVVTWETSSKFKDGADIEHDGQSVFMIDPQHAIGLEYGGSQFDYDFVFQGCANARHDRSLGQTTDMRIGMVLKRALDEKIMTIEYKAAVHTDAQRAAFEFLQPRFEGEHKPTLLLDEPDTGLDLDMKYRLWIPALGSLRKQFQIIIATHNPLAMRKALGANVIDLKPGFYKECRNLVLSFPVK